MKGSADDERAGKTRRGAQAGVAWWARIERPCTANATACQQHGGDGDSHCKGGMKGTERVVAVRVSRWAVSVMCR